MKAVVGALCGTVFGFGLAASGMTSREKVLGFLDLFGQWIPDLAFVMAAALLVKVLTFHSLIKKRKPVFADNHGYPTNKTIDRQLVTGALIFGVGWGVYGFCPGPSLSAMVYQDAKAAAFVAAMVVGMWLASRIKPLK